MADTVAVVRATIDRRTGWLVLAVVALVFLVIVPTVRPAPVDEAPVLRDLVERAVRADGFDHTVSERTSRTVGGVGSTAATVTTIWMAHDRWRTEITGDLTVITTADAVITCRAGNFTTCLTTPSAPTRSAAVPYLAAVTTGRYSIARVGADRVAGEAVDCFGLVARQADLALGGLGERLTVCVTLDGLVLRSERQSGRTTDIRVATAVQRSVRAEDRRRITTAVRHR